MIMSWQYCFFSASVCCGMPGRDIDILFGVFYGSNSCINYSFVWPFQVSIMHHQVSIVTPTITEIQKTLGCNFLALFFASILRKPHLVFLLAVPVDYPISVFRSRLSFLLSTPSPILIVYLKLDLQLPLICMLAMCLSDSWWSQSGKFQGLGVRALC